MEQMHQGVFGGLANELMSQVDGYGLDLPGQLHLLLLLLPFLVPVEQNRSDYRLKSLEWHAIRYLVYKIK
jgi:hypothetical protein